MFSSRNTQKIYCSLKCYTSSTQFKAMLATNREKIIPTAPELSREMREKIAAKLRRGEMVPCLECGIEVYRKRCHIGKRKFCTTVCYRAYMAKRFDRWIANPESLALPQCYDEFLDREELPCIVEGCGWRGKALTLHVNQAHGIRADEFKRAAGFNLGTGVIARPLAEILQGREKQGVAGPLLGAFDRSAGLPKNFVRYWSIEAREHRAKNRALAGYGPLRTCRSCGVKFQQSTPFGKAVYCTRVCRDDDYARAAKMKRQGFIRTHDENGRFRWLPAGGSR